ncbi:MAG: PilZ domain-containing protein [Desulfobulbales bacterium]|nr:PilZ domain-containing protein [Desulfobulbales bacterium]
MPEAEFSKTYVMPDNTAVLNCPYCGQWRTIQADRFRGSRHKIRVRCFCQETFKVFLEFRKKIRKKTFLKGSHSYPSRKGSRGDIVILDISVIGLAFSSLDAPGFKVDDELIVEFTLDQENGTDIRRDVIVRNIRKRRVGCEFELSGGVFDDQLGYFVMS